MYLCNFFLYLFFFQAEDGIRDLVRSRGLGDVYKRQVLPYAPGVPVVTAQGGASTHTAFMSVEWTAPITTYSGDIWYYKVYQKQTSGYALAGITSDTVWSVSYTHLTLPTIYSV
eukprot:TRINITY_DN6076_c0_g1_i1.p1 TRINITY_DN6076_c0_g1~~TRINITY_DN6076_c0_g1_i1.p1  ORF type:complete len:114 (+),score=47.80 TRINITY_DN6076_c0_g1_i1:39-380(+)